MKGMTRTAPSLVSRINADARRSGVADSIEQFENIATHRQYRLAYEKATQYLSPGSSVLDWGCGNGHFSLFLEAVGANPTGYSFDPPPPCLASSPRFRHVRGCA